MVALLALTGCGRGQDNEADVRSQVATGVAATQAAQEATAAAEIAIAQAVEATVTALAAQTADGDEVDNGESAPENTPVAAATPPTVVNTFTPTPAAPADTSTPALAAATQAPTQAPTPTPIALVVLPGGGGGDGLEGDIVTAPGIFSIGDDPDTPIFSRFLSLQLLAYSPEVGEEDGAGVDYVEITVYDDQGEPVYSRIEEQAGFCLFGGGAPDCNILRLEPGVLWPGTQRPVANGGYAAIFGVEPASTVAGSGEWNQFFEIRVPGNDAPDSGYGDLSGLVAELVESGRGSAGQAVSGSLVFQVAAYDSRQGTRDGDGIAHVVLRIVGPDGEEVYRKQENDAAYCAFGGDAPCGPWNFADENYRWPDGEPIEQGSHRLQALVVAANGDSEAFDWPITIE